MRILIYTINYSPEIIGIAKYNNEFIEYLLSKGHEVRIITAPPYYPQWRVWKKYSSYKYKYESRNDGFLKIFRCPIFIPKKPFGILRILYLLSFFISSFPIMLLQIFWRPKIIFLTEPPLICAPIALIIGLVSFSKTILHIHDFEIDAAFNLNQIKGVFLKKILLFFERLIMNCFSKVTTISINMQKKLINKGVKKSKTYTFKNWVDTSLVNPNKISSSNIIQLKKQYKIPRNNLIVFYSGNMGKKQGIDELINLINDCLKSNIFFILAGDGPEKRKLILQKKNLSNLLLLPLQSQDSYLNLLFLSDVLLLPQIKEIGDLVLPSKLITMISSGRPIIATADPNTEIANILNDCGVVVKPGDRISIFKALIFLKNSKEVRNNLGNKARLKAINYYDKKKILDDFLSKVIGDEKN